jgi:hypothetical protein
VAIVNVKGTCKHPMRHYKMCQGTCSMRPMYWYCGSHETTTVSNRTAKPLNHAQVRQVGMGHHHTFGVWLIRMCIEECNVVRTVIKLLGKKMR